MDHEPTGLGRPYATRFSETSVSLYLSLSLSLSLSQPRHANGQICLKGHGILAGAFFLNDAVKNPQLPFIECFSPSKDPEPLQCLVCRGSLWPPKNSADGPAQLEKTKNMGFALLVRIKFRRSRNCQSRLALHGTSRTLPSRTCWWPGTWPDGLASASRAA